MANRADKYGFVKTLKTEHQVLFALLVATGIVAFWRGAWGIMDVFLLPDNYLASSVISLLIGICLLAGLHVIVSEFVYE